MNVDKPVTNSSHINDIELRKIKRYLNIPMSAIDGPPSGTIVTASQLNNLPALFPYPANSAGGKLLTLSGLTPGQFLGRFNRCELVPGVVTAWDTVAAKHNAELLKLTFPHGHRVILHGLLVGVAFGDSSFFDRVEENGVTYICIPSVSGGKDSLYSNVNARVGAKASLQFAARLLK